MSQTQVAPFSEKHECPKCGNTVLFVVRWYLKEGLLGVHCICRNRWWMQPKDAKVEPDTQ